MKKLLRKIAPATVCPGKLKRLDVEGAPKEVVLYDVYGITNDVKQGESNFGPWLQFKGQFEAVTPDGEVVVSGSLFLQDPFQDMLFGQLTDVKAGDNHGSVQFGCRVSIVPPKPGKATSTGYEYQCIPLLQSDNSPLDHVRALVAEATKNLALPANTPKATGKAATK